MMCLGVAELDGHLLQPSLRHSLPGPRDHRLGDVDAEHVALLAHELGEPEQGLSGSAADVERALTQARREPVHDTATERFELRVELPFEPHPRLTCLGFPALIGAKFRLALHGPSLPRIARKSFAAALARPPLKLD